MKTLTRKLTILVASFIVAAATLLVPVVPANAADCDPGSNPTQGGINCAQGEGTPTELFGDGSIFTTVVNIMLFIIGAISVVMLIFGGIRYTTSGGNSNSVTAAKNTIMYAIIGLIIAFLAFAIVNWVLGAITPSGTA